MQYLIVFLLVIFFNNPSQAQTLSFKVVDEYRGSVSKEATMLVDSSSFLYECKQVAGHKWVGQVKLSMPYEDYRWFLDLKSGTFTKHKVLKNGTKLISTFQPKALNWQLVEEEKVILGYRCYKAILAVNDSEELTDTVFGDIIAWYCPDIPISGGVGGLYGLPGMIFSQEYSIATAFTSRVVSVEKTDMTIQKPSDGLEVPKEVIVMHEPSKKVLKKYQTQQK